MEKALICKTWKSKKMIPEEFFDESQEMEDIITFLEKTSTSKPLFIDRNIIVHDSGIYEGVFLEDHFEKIKHLFKDLEEPDGDSLQGKEDKDN